jgi:hypothetical protein
MTSTIAAYGLPVRTPTAYDRRRAAVRQAAQVIAFDGVVVLGVESDPATGRVYEVAAIDTVGRMLIDTLVNPGVSIASKNLTDQMLAGAPTFGQVFADLLIHAGRKTVATYTSWISRPFFVVRTSTTVTRGRSMTQAVGTSWRRPGRSGWASPATTYPCSPITAP